MALDFGSGWSGVFCYHRIQVGYERFFEQGEVGWIRHSVGRHLDLLTVTWSGSGGAGDDDVDQRYRYVVQPDRTAQGSTAGCDCEEESRKVG